MRWFFRSDYRSFYLLNATQFLGALNDNIFKLLVIYFLIHLKGAAEAPKILSLAGAIFVIPFLLFSSGAGVLADKISKRTIIVIAKCMELAVMLLAVGVIYFGFQWGAYATLFLMATHSALFGPSKYGIIPELVEEKMVPKANGSITSFTYLAIILGTFLASFITDITNKNFVLESLVCVVIAAIGLLTSLGITRTEPQRSTKKINPVFLYEIYQTLRSSHKVPHLLTTIFGSAFFLFVGSFTQLNIIPFAMQSLHLSEVGGGYLFLATAVGIAIGAVIAGQISKERVELGLSCIAGFFIALFFFTLAIFASSLICTIISLALLGIVGGGFLIPLDSYIQVNSPDEKRGQIIAASNFFSFIGVLCSAFFLYFTSEELGLKSASSFGFIGCLAFLASLFLAGRLSSFFFPFFAQKILKRFRRPILASPLPDSRDLIFLESHSWWDAILLFGWFPSLKILIPNSCFRSFPWFSGLVDSLRLISLTPEASLEEAQKVSVQIETWREQKVPLCLFFCRRQDTKALMEGYAKIFQRLHYRVVRATLSKEKIAKRWLFIRFKQTQVSFSFGPEE